MRLRFFGPFSGQGLSSIDVFQANVSKRTGRSCRALRIDRLLQPV